MRNLGRRASHGCVRLSVADAKWVYTNCPMHENHRVLISIEGPGRCSLARALIILEGEMDFIPSPATVWGKICLSPGRYCAVPHGHAEMGKHSMVAAPGPRIDGFGHGHVHLLRRKLPYLPRQPFHTIRSAPLPCSTMTLQGCVGAVLP